MPIFTGAMLREQRRDGGVQRNCNPHTRTDTVEEHTMQSQSEVSIAAFCQTRSAQPSRTATWPSASLGRAAECACRPLFCRAPLCTEVCLLSCIARRLRGASLQRAALLCTALRAENLGRGLLRWGAARGAACVDHCASRQQTAVSQRYNVPRRCAWCAALTCATEECDRSMLASGRHESRYDLIAAGSKLDRRPPHAACDYARSANRLC